MGTRRRRRRRRRLEKAKKRHSITYSNVDITKACVCVCAYVRVRMCPPLDDIGQHRVLGSFRCTIRQSWRTHCPRMHPHAPVQRTHTHTKVRAHALRLSSPAGILTHRVARRALGTCERVCVCVCACVCVQLALSWDKHAHFNTFYLHSGTKCALTFRRHFTPQTAVAHPYRRRVRPARAGVLIKPRRGRARNAFALSACARARA